MNLQLIQTPEEICAFETAFDAYLADDIMPTSDLGEPLTEEDFRYFHSNAYQSTIQGLCVRSIDPVHRYFVVLDGERIGFCMCCTYHSEDGKCFVMEICIHAPYRSRGLGKACFELLKEQEKATFFELSTSSSRARRFWESLGFQPNGYREDGSFMMVLPPGDSIIQCEVLQGKDIPQVLSLQNNYKRVVGEPMMTEDQQLSLREAMESGQILFFVAKRLTRVVGMCSVCRIYSTYRCCEAGIFEDFYIEPVFRGQGIARKLTNYVQKACTSEGLVSLWVGCASVDMPMYQALGFSIKLGNLLTWNQE